jgi:hypothetical protein
LVLVELATIKAGRIIVEVEHESSVTTDGFGDKIQGSK